MNMRWPHSTPTPSLICLSQSSQSDYGIVRARTSDDNLWVNYQLSDLEQGLSEFNFFRAHRASLVNLRRVKEIRPSPRSAFLLVMDDAARTQIEVSERQARVLRTIIPGL